MKELGKQAAQRILIMNYREYSDMSHEDRHEVLKDMTTSEAMELVFNLIETNPHIPEDQKEKGKQLIFQQNSSMRGIKNPQMRAAEAFRRMSDSAAKLAASLKSLRPLERLRSDDD